MPRGLDHIVHAVRDLDAAAQAYRKLGFTVGARNRHPWGTHNYIVQFPGFFIELLTFAEPDKLGSDGFSKLFAAFNRDFIARGEGLSMMILESQDAAGDERAFDEAGIAASEAMRFEREGSRPDGAPVKVAFSLAFANDKDAPGIHFATCQQHYPENFWNPAFQRHQNGVTSIAGVVMVANDPAAHKDFFAAFTGATPASLDADGLHVDLPRGAIDVMTPQVFRRHYGFAAPDVSGGARLAALRFATATQEARQEMRQEMRQEIRQETVLGAVLLFEPSNSAGGR